MFRIPELAELHHAQSVKRRRPREGSPRWPAFLPDGKHFIFFQLAPEAEGEESFIWARSTRHQDTTLVASQYRAQYAGGHLVFVRGGNLMSQAFDEKKFKLSGNPVPIAEQIRGEGRGAAAFSLSTTAN